MLSQINGKRVTLTYIVADLNVVPVLGRMSCVKFIPIKRVQAVAEEDDIFKGLGCFKGFDYNLDSESDTKIDIQSVTKASNRQRHSYTKLSCL